MSDNSYIRGVHLSDSQREELLNRLDRSAEERATVKSPVAKSNRRVHRRWAFRQADIPLTVTHPGGSTARLLVYGRNISVGGMGFVHGGFLHIGSRCRLALRQIDGTMVPIDAEVVNCRHLEGALHEVGLKFSHRIEAANFVLQSEAEPEQLDSSVQVEPMQGRVLCIDDSVDDQNLMKFLLETCGLDVVMCNNGVEGLEQSESGRFNLLLIELMLPGLPGVELVEMLRASGNTTPVIAMTPDEDPATRNFAISKGCTELLIKPVEFHRLVQVVSACLSQNFSQSRKESARQEPLASTRWDEVRLQPLILSFISHLQAQVDQLQQAIDTNDAQRLQKLALTLKGTAGGYGYPTLSQAALELRNLCAAGATVQSLRNQLTSVATICDAASLFAQQMTNTRS